MVVTYQLGNQYVNKANLLLLPGLCLYWYLAQKRVYGESAAITFAKGFFLNQGYGCLLFFTIGLGLVINLIWTLINP